MAVRKGYKPGWPKLNSENEPADIPPRG